MGKVARALVLLPFTSRRAAERAAEQVRESYPEHGLLVTDGEAGAYLNASTGETGYLLTLRGPWSVERQSDGEIILKCRRSDAQPASEEARNG